MVFVSFSSTALMYFSITAMLSVLVLCSLPEHAAIKMTMAESAGNVLMIFLWFSIIVSDGRCEFNFAAMPGQTGHRCMPKTKGSQQEILNGIVYPFIAKICPWTVDDVA